MEFLIAFFGALILGAITTLVGAQANASAPALARWIVRRAVQRLPEDMRERYSEEWLGVVEDVPGPLLKVWTAFGFVISTGALIRERATKLATQSTSGEQPVVKWIWRIPLSAAFRRALWAGIRSNAEIARAISKAPTPLLWVMFVMTGLFWMSVVFLFL